MKRSRVVYMKITKDKYELPVAVASSVRELAEMCNTTENTINSWMYHYKNKSGKYKFCPYIKVVIDE